MNSSTAGDMAAGASEAQQLLDSFWPKVVEDIKNLSNSSFKTQELPLARIKKIMKLDDDVKAMMISAEAPVLFAKAAEIFINELSLRAWVHTEDNKRRTLQRNDIAMAITKYDQFDFLIDIVPRDEIKPPAKRSNSQSSGNISLTDALQTDQVQYVVQHPAFQSTTAPGQPIQLLQTPAGLQVAGAGQTQFALSGQQLLQLQVPSNAAGDASTPASSTGQIQYQIMTANGEVQSIPIQLNQMLRMQPGLTGQPILIQSPGGPASYQIASQGGQQFLVAGQPTTTVGTQEDEAGLEETDN